ncbi:unnamed protein product, partial [Meganyctiphanes norvegica]
DKAFTNGISLISHLKTHTGEKPYQCSQCDKVFTNSIDLIDLISHMNTHTEEKPYQCRLFDKAFQQNSNLKSNTKTHTGKKPCQCTQCNRSFMNNDDLISHLMTHSREKQFQVSNCHKVLSKKRTQLMAPVKPGIEHTEMCLSAPVRKKCPACKKKYDKDKQNNYRKKLKRLKTKSYNISKYEHILCLDC